MLKSDPPWRKQTMAIFTEENFIELCRDVRNATYVLTPENLIDQLRKSIRNSAGLDPYGGLDPTESEEYSRMEAHLLDIVRIVEAQSNLKFDVLALINKEIVGWAAQWQAGIG